MIETDLDASQFAVFADRAMNQLGAAVETALAETMAEGADRARQAPFKDQSGELRQSIEGDIEGRFADSTLEGYIKAEADHALFVEQDTKAHVIAAKGVGVSTDAAGRQRNGQGKFVGKGAKKGVLSWQDAGGERHFARIVHHPGTKGTHFISTSMTEEEVNARIDAAVETALDNITGGSLP